MATFRIDQATQPAGTPGRSRIDLVAAQTVTLTATDPAPGAGVSYAWEILDKAGTGATLSAASGTSVTIASGSIVAPCTLLVRLTATDNGTVTYTDRKLAVPAPLSGVILPVFGESAPSGQKFSSNTPDSSTDNAVYANRGGTGATEQNWRGWTEVLHKIAVAVEGAYSAGSGINQLTGDATAGPGTGSQAVTVAQARGLRETAGPTTLTMGAVADGEYLRRSGTTVIGGTPAGGGTCCDGVYFYQPGGVQTGSTYNDFGDLYLAANAEVVPVTVFLDDSLGAVEIPAATYDFNGWLFKSRGIEPVSMALMDGVAIPYAGTNAYKIRFENVNVVADPGGLTSPVFYDNGGGSPPTLALELVNSSMAGDTANTVALIDISPAAAGANVNFTLYDSIVYEWSVEGDNTSGSVSMTVTGYGYSFLADTAFQGTATYLNLIQRTSFGSLSRSPNLTATSSSFDNTGGDRVRLTWNESQTGTAEASIGMIYLLEGTVIPTANVMIGALGGGTDSATLRLRRFTGGTLIETWTVTGAVAETGVAAPIEIANSDWYEFTLAAGGAAQTALAKGVFMNLYTANIQPPG